MLYRCSNTLKVVHVHQNGLAKLVTRRRMEAHWLFAQNRLKKSSPELISWRREVCDAIVKSIQAQNRCEGPLFISNLIICTCLKFQEGWTTRDSECDHRKRNKKGCKISLSEEEKILDLGYFQTLFLLDPILGPFLFFILSIFLGFFLEPELFFEKYKALCLFLTFKKKSSFNVMLLFFQISSNF